MAEENRSDKSTEAAHIVRNHAIGALSAGLLPMPLLDGVILGGVQLRMVKQLAKLYEVEFSEQQANAILGSLAGVSAAATATGFLRVLGVGGALLSFGALSSLPASTYAIGRVFIKHFESGGTFLNFDPSRAKKEYDDKLAEVKKDDEPSYAGIKP